MTMEEDKWCEALTRTGVNQASYLEPNKASHQLESRSEILWVALLVEINTTPPETTYPPSGIM